MAKSIRISDELYEIALQQAALAERSLAQQIEHWVKLGIGFEHSAGVTADDLRAAALRYRHLRDEVEVRSGRRTPESLHAVPASLVKKAKVEFPSSAFATKRKTW